MGLGRRTEARQRPVHRHVRQEPQRALRQLLGIRVDGHMARAREIFRRRVRRAVHRGPRLKMSIDDIKRTLLPIGSGGKILQAIQTAAVIGLGGWMASTVSSDHYAISSMASDIN